VSQVGILNQMFPGQYLDKSVQIDVLYLTFDVRD
jgi:hypothetical protein